MLSNRVIKNLIWIALACAVLYGVNALLGFAEEHNRPLIYYFRLLRICGIFVTLAVSLNLINGITGEFSLGHAGFYAIGAYLAAGFTHYFAMPRLFGPNWVNMSASDYGAKGALVLLMAMVIGGVSAALAGYLVGMPTLRLRGDYLAILTLGFGEIVRNIFLNAQVFNAQRGFGGVHYEIPELANFFWIWLLAVACIACSRNLLKSAHGLAFLSVREDEVAANAMGINTARYKVTAFVIGAAFAGMAGALYAHYIIFIESDSFKMDVSIIVVTMVVLGGQGSITGSVVAGFGLSLIQELLRDLPSKKIGSIDFALADLRLVIFSLLLIFAMLFRPQGLFGHREIGFNSFKRLFGRRKAAQET